MAVIVLNAVFLWSDLTEEFYFISNLYKDGYYDAALREIANIEGKLAEDQFGNQILSLKADILVKQGNSIEAINILQRLETLPLSPELKGQVLLNKALVERNLGNNQESFRLLNEYTARFPDSDRQEEVSQLLGDLYLEQLQFAEAEEIFTKLHKSNKSPQSYINMIRINAETDKLSEAEGYLNELKKDFPKEHLAEQQGLLYVLRGYEKQQNFEKVIELCPAPISPTTAVTDDLIMQKIVAFIHLRNYEEAQRLLSELKDDSINADYYRAMIHKEKGEYNQALVLFRRLQSASGATAEIKAMSFFNIVQITAQSSTAEAFALLQDYLLRHPGQEWEGDILYQLAFIDYQQEKFETALDFVTRSLSFSLNNANSQKAIYLKGEVEFLLADYESSLKTFTDNITNTPDAFIDETLFKIGLCNYFLGKPDIASKYFTQLIMNHPGSDKVGVAYFYLGEIELHRNLNFARTYYQQSFSGNMDEGAIRLRLAYIDYMKREFDSANSTLDLVPETSDYLYDKHLLKGNIYFAQRNFIEALESYRIAERNAQDQVSVEYIWSRQAWTHYNLKNYDTATQIYRRLAQESDSPGKYILSAAGAAYNAELYEQAKDLYEEFLETYPDSAETNRAVSGLANCYFNMGLYVAAIESWSDLVKEDNDANVVESALKGMQTSYQRLSREADFVEFLNLARLRNTEKDFVIRMYDYKAQYEYEQKNYASSISTINQLFNQFPEMSTDQKMLILLANNHSWQMQYAEADQIYIDLARRTDDPYIYYEWGNIRWAQKDYEAAMIRFKRAADNSNNELYWTTLLEKLVIRKDSDFMKYYHEFSRFASDYHKHLVMLNYIDWLQQNRNYDQAVQVAETILESSYAQLRPRATYKKAETLFLAGKYDLALTDFLRIRYIFSEVSDLRWASELYIAKIYLAQNERNRAREHFDNIRGNLSPEQIAEFERMMR